MYFPAVVDSQNSMIARSVVWPHWDKGTCMVMRDNFGNTATFNSIIDYVLKTTPDEGLVQEIKVTKTGVGDG